MVRGWPRARGRERGDRGRRARSELVSKRGHRPQATRGILRKHLAKNAFEIARSPEARRGGSSHSTAEPDRRFSFCGCDVHGADDLRSLLPLESEGCLEPGKGNRPAQLPGAGPTCAGTSKAFESPIDSPALRQDLVGNRPSFPVTPTFASSGFQEGYR